ncbi:MAG TPA: hypothetical protein VM870_01815 [Pyrinomonadaceae bacterium]|nr:hypothetical protein [Pyrinomonadaceae bacterium]
MANQKRQNISDEKSSAAAAGAQSHENAQTINNENDLGESYSESGLTNPNSQQNYRPQDGSPIGGGAGDFRQTQK